MRGSMSLRVSAYLKPGEHPTVKDLAEKSAIPSPKIAVVPDPTLFC